MDRTIFFYKTDQDALYPSVYINWVFMNLDRSFEEAFEVTLTPLFPNVSCMCTQVWVSVITGNQITDLLREVPYNQVRIYFEKSISVALEKELTILNPSTCNIKCNKRSNVTSLKEFKKTFLEYESHLLEMRQTHSSHHEWSDETKSV